MVVKERVAESAVEVNVELYLRQRAKERRHREIDDEEELRTSQLLRSVACRCYGVWRGDCESVS